jgi:hypothetical protein
MGMLMTAKDGSILLFKEDKIKRLIELKRSANRVFCSTGQYSNVTLYMMLELIASIIIEDADLGPKIEVKKELILLKDNVKKPKAKKKAKPYKFNMIKPSSSKRSKLPKKFGRVDGKRF